LNKSLPHMQVEDPDIGVEQSEIPPPGAQGIHL